MACREDAGKSWYGKERRIIEDIKLIYATEMESCETYQFILKLWEDITFEVLNLLDKLDLGDHLVKLASGKGEVQKERVQEIKEGLQSIFEQMRDVYIKFENEKTRVNKESKSWQEFLLAKSKSYDELKRMKAEERKGLLKKHGACLSVFISGKRMFQGFKTEWDDLKPEFDQSVVGFMKELVVIAKGPAEHQIEE